MTAGAPPPGPPAGLRLDLRGRGLRAVPDEVFDQAGQLEVLDLSGNALEDLPADLARLERLRVLFCSDNRFTRMPEVIGRCPALEMVGFKANRIDEVPEAALPPRLRWLILTDNRLPELPASIGRCTRLQKLMLAGNRLERLPAELAACERLELLRLSANAFTEAGRALPAWLLALPRLAWLAYAGNPFCSDWETAATADVRPVPWAALEVGERLGEGASGLIHAARWQNGDSPPRDVAVKLFKGTMTSDGLPASERAACLAAGPHPNLVPVLGHLTGHPEGREGLVLGRIPPGHRNLAGPPSLASCTRDVYDDGLSFDAAAAARLVRGVASAVAQLHARGLLHGDLYAHNILVADDGSPLLGDFGAASFLPLDDQPRREALQALDRRALGWLQDELAQRTRA